MSLQEPEPEPQQEEADTTKISSKFLVQDIDKKKQQLEKVSTYLLFTQLTLIILETKK